VTVKPIQKVVISQVSHGQIISAASEKKEYIKNNNTKKGKEGTKRAKGEDTRRKFVSCCTGGEGLLDLLSLLLISHFEGVEVLGAADLELGHTLRLFDLNACNKKKLPP